MIEQNMRVSDITYGTILDACAKTGQMKLAMKIFNHLKQFELNMNSIVFTTVIKGLLKKQAYNEAIEFFSSIKSYKSLPGMIITFNCALDVYIKNNQIDKAVSLFREIEGNFGADLISYSTLIKGYCVANRRKEGLELLKKMILNQSQRDISVVNLYIDCCSNKEYYNLGIQAYQYAMMKNITPNEITFGIMIKIYGFSRELQKAFDLLDLMQGYGIKPSLIVYTNLIHISFYNKKPRKAELAVTLFKKLKKRGDFLMYSKIIDGLIRFKVIKRVPKYIDMALKDGCSLKKTTIESIQHYFKSKEMSKKIQQLVKNQKTQKKFYKQRRNQRFKNKFNEENPKKYKEMIKERKEKYKNTGKKNYKNTTNNRQPIKLYNFRNKNSI